MTIILLHYNCVSPIYTAISLEEGDTKYNMHTEANHYQLIKLLLSVVPAVGSGVAHPESLSVTR